MRYRPVVKGLGAWKNSRVPLALRKRSWQPQSSLRRRILASLRTPCSPPPPLLYHFRIRQGTLLFSKCIFPSWSLVAQLGLSSSGSCFVHHCAIELSVCLPGCPWRRARPLTPAFTRREWQATRELFARSPFSAPNTHRELFLRTPTREADQKRAAAKCGPMMKGSRTKALEDFSMPQNSCAASR